MKVRELMEALRECNQEAVVVVNADSKIGDYTWATEEFNIHGLLPWPEPANTANTIELVLDK